MIWNLGSINVDHVYAVPHMPGPGETLSSTALSFGLGGKGANQSVAATRAGAKVRHIGAVGADGEEILARLGGYGVDVSGVLRTEVPTGHAIINVDPGGENSIVLFNGANHDLTGIQVQTALSRAAAGDILMMQNETSAQSEAARIGREKGLCVIYSAAPFGVEAVRDVLPYISILVMNEVEENQLHAALGKVDVPERIVTLGARGARWHVGDAMLEQPAFRVDVVDTTAAGDTFIGTIAAMLDAHAERAEALRMAAASSALKVTRHGAADGIPTRDEVLAFLKTAAG